MPNGCVQDTKKTQLPRRKVILNISKPFPPIFLHEWTVICRWCNRHYNRYWWGTLSLRKGELVFCRVFFALRWETFGGTIQLQFPAIQHSGSSIAVARSLGRWEDESIAIVLVWFEVHKEDIVPVGRVYRHNYPNILQNRLSLPITEQSPIIGCWAPIWPQEVCWVSGWT